jgi:hypothetical protein
MDTWYWLGEGRSEAGDPAGARIAWTEALKFATADDDRKEIQARIDHR